MSMSGRRPGDNKAPDTEQLVQATKMHKLAQQREKLMQEIQAQTVKLKNTTQNPKPQSTASILQAQKSTLKHVNTPTAKLNVAAEEVKSDKIIKSYDEYQKALKTHEQQKAQSRLPGVVYDRLWKPVASQFITKEDQTQSQEQENVSAATSAPTPRTPGK